MLQHDSCAKGAGAGGQSAPSELGTPGVSGEGGVRPVGRRDVERRAGPLHRRRVRVRSLGADLPRSL